MFFKVIYPATGSDLRVATGIDLVSEQQSGVLTSAILKFSASLKRSTSSLFV